MQCNPIRIQQVYYSNAQVGGFAGIFYFLHRHMRHGQLTHFPYLGISLSTRTYVYYSDYRVFTDIISHWLSYLMSLLCTPGA